MSNGRGRGRKPADITTDDVVLFHVDITDGVNNNIPVKGRFPVYVDVKKSLKTQDGKHKAPASVKEGYTHFITVGMESRTHANKFVKAQVRVKGPEVGYSKVVPSVTDVTPSVESVAA